MSPTFCRRTTSSSSHMPNRRRIYSNGFIQIKTKEYEYNIKVPYFSCTLYFNMNRVNLAGAFSDKWSMLDKVKVSKYINKEAWSIRMRGFTTNIYSNKKETTTEQCYPKNTFYFFFRAFFLSLFLMVRTVDIKVISNESTLIKKEWSFLLAHRTETLLLDKKTGEKKIYRLNQYKMCYSLLVGMKKKSNSWGTKSYISSTVSCNCEIYSFWNADAWDVLSFLFWVQTAFLNIYVSIYM